MLGIGSESTSIQVDKNQRETYMLWHCDPKPVQEK